MNHIYRIVWNRVRHAFMVVAENTRRSGSGAGRGAGGPIGSVGVFVLSALGAAVFVNTAQAGGVEVASGNTQVFQAPNGVQVIDIATANGAGVSHNRYLNYNVDPSGQILNNNSALTRAGALQSQLGGQIVPNVNLTNEARVILNEVVGTNRSTLAGYTEVVGGKADVIVANPYGITCSGCGFINTDRATLTTGVPIIGSNGSVAGFQVRQGDILVEGNGLDGRNQKVLDLVARSVKIDGQINAQDLQIAAGSNDYDYANRSASATAPTGDTPLYAIDSTALGGMYANRIQLLATENGVGVRMRGEVAASADDFMLSASGKIEINTRISAERDLKVNTVASAGIEANAASLSSRRDLEMRGGSVTLSDIELSSGTSSQAGALTVNATNGDLKLNRSQAHSAGTLGLQASKKITSDAQSEIKSVGDFTLKAGTAVDHAGKLLGAAKGKVEAGTSVTNSNVIHAADTLQVNAVNIINTDTAGMSSLADLKLDASTGIDNAGALYAGQHMDLKAGNTLRNRSTGTLDSNDTLSATAANLINNGAIVSLGDMHLKASQSFINETLWSGGTLTKKDGSPSYGSVISEDKIANEGAFDNGMNAWMYDESFQYNEELVGLTMAQLQALQKAQIIASGAGSTLTIDYGASGLNRVGVISAPTVEIKGTGTFTNEELALYHYEKVLRWIRIDDEASGDDTFIAWARTRPDAAYAPTGDPDDDSYNWDNWEPGSLSGWTRTRRIDGDSWPTVLADEAREMAVAGGTLKNASVIARSGAGIFATSLTFEGGTLVNAGSPWPDDQDKARLDGQIGASVNAPNINLPGNPNGYFVPSKNPGAKYLVETNPIFAVGSNFVGSDYLAQRYGFNPDTVQTRLGDANYEAYLIRQQLIQQTGNNVIAGYDNEADQMQRLMDQAYTQGQALGLIFGQTPSAEQLAALTEDIVWMEETVVNGQSVLAPRVYLAASTVAALDSGAVIAARDTRISGEGLSNTGGTISGSGSLTVNTRGDITNTSGTIKGGDVSLTSSEGSIRNETLAIGTGDATTYTTAIGKTGSIESTGNLNLDAARNIEVIGADVSAKGNASLNAGGDIVVDTIVNKNTSTSYTESSGFLSSSSTRTSVGTETNVGSRLNIQGDLTTRSGGDTTIAGSQVDVGGNLDAEAEGSFNVVARQDKLTVDTQTKTSGLGVGGGLYGTQKTTTNDFTGTNAGSTLNVGGNANVRAGEQIVLQGSDANIAGNANLDGREGISVLDGLDERRTSQVVETTTFLKVDGSGGASTGTSAAANVQGASASAEASASSSANLKLMETSKTVTNSGSNTSVASNLNVGGNLQMQSDRSVTVQGSNVAAGGDLDVQARDIQVLTGRNESWSESQTDRTSLGIYTDSKASAGASATANSNGSGNVQTNVKAEVTATAGVRTENEQSSSYDLTNTASTLKSGGNMNLQAKDTATFQGAQVSSGGDMNIDAQDIKNVAAQDISTRSDSASTHTAGVYVGGSAEASAKAGVDENGQASASAGASAEASAGLRQSTEKSDSKSTSITQVTNTFSSGGNFTRTAQNTIVDQGTQVDAGGNITQSAREIRDEAVSNQSYSSDSSYSHDARVGAYVGAEAKASTDEGASAGTGYGAKASVEGSAKNASSQSSTAVTSGFKAGGSISSASTEQTTLVGTRFEAGEDINIQAGSLDVQAARNTSSSSSSSKSLDAEVKVGTDGGSVKANYGQENANESASDASAASLNAGGKLTIKTTGDARFEGTELSSGGDTRIDAGGNVDFQAARSESSSSSSNLSANASFSKSEEGDKNGEAGLAGGISQGKSNQAQGGTINSGGAVQISSGGNTNLEGTQVRSEGDTRIGAGGKVNLGSATSTSSEFGVQAGVSATASSSKKDGDQGSSSVSGAVQGGASRSSQGSTIQSGGKTSIEEGRRN